MARKRISMKALRLVIQLHEETTLSNRQISVSAGVSRPVVAEYIAAYRRSGLSFAEISKLSDTEAVERLRTAKPITDTRNSAALAFFPYMIKELPRVGVTRELLWTEYRAKHPDGYEYSQFCNLFRLWHGAESEVTFIMDHKAGDRMYVDFTGAKMSYREHGVEREVELFLTDCCRLVGPGYSHRCFIGARYHTCIYGFLQFRSNDDRCN